MKARITSYAALFGDSIDRVQIPILQRDYAQGRDDQNATSIRKEFLRDLRAALTHGDPLGLDFVYGTYKEGALVPLDGQQRLTTLFLLHWYLAWRAGQPGAQSWSRLTYETRSSARRFCQRLATYAPADTDGAISDGIRDQSWFLSTWLHDPTISAMLVMIDAIHAEFAAVDASAAWQRLVEVERPAVFFHVLPIEEFGLGDELYIRMNSRGRPLTAFENFKARFEQFIGEVAPASADGEEALKDSFARKVDGDWSDLLWPHKGEDDLIDDEFLRYFAFLTDLAGWIAGEAGPREADPMARAEAAFRGENAVTRLRWLIGAFDCWKGVDSGAWFSSLLSIGPQPQRIAIYGSDGSADSDIFAACLREYAPGRPGPGFTLQRTLLLAGVIFHRMGATSEFPGRLRILRNLVENSPDEIRLEAMPKLIADVRAVVDGELNVRAFNQRQAAEERRKSAFIEKYPALQPALETLEDHPLLRGCLGAFVLDADVFQRRASAFHEAFTELELATGALLACGHYGQLSPHKRFFRFGSKNAGTWRDLLAVAGRAAGDPLVVALAVMLDRFAAAPGSARGRLGEITEAGLDAHGESGFYDWRYYFLAYSSMREAPHGYYATLGGRMGFQVCMLGGVDMRSSHRDPFLRAVYIVAAVTAKSVDPGALWFRQYEWDERWLVLNNGAALRCTSQGYAVRIPDDGSRPSIEAVCKKHGVEGGILRVLQEERDGELFDTSDRVQVGAALLRDLAAV